MAAAGGRGARRDAARDRLAVRRLRSSVRRAPLTAAALPRRGPGVRRGGARPGPRRTGTQPPARHPAAGRGLRLRDGRSARAAARRDHADHPSACARPRRAHRSPAAPPDGRDDRRHPGRGPRPRRPVHHGHVHRTVGARQRAARAPPFRPGVLHRHGAGEQRRVPALHGGRRVHRRALVGGRGLGADPQARPARPAVLAPRGQPVAAPALRGRGARTGGRAGPACELVRGRRLRTVGGAAAALGGRVGEGGPPRPGGGRSLPPRGATPTPPRSGPTSASATCGRRRWGRTPPGSPRSAYGS